MPTMLIVYVPAGVAPPTETVSVLVAVPPGVRVIVVGLREAERPWTTGTCVAKLMVPPKLMLLSVTVNVLVKVSPMLRLEGLTEIPKSWTLTVGDAEWEIVPS